MCHPGIFCKAKNIRDLTRSPRALAIGSLGAQSATGDTTAAQAEGRAKKTSPKQDIHILAYQYTGITE